MRWGDYSCNPYKHKKMCYANPLWMGWIESERNKKECSWKKKGGMKGLLCHLFPFHSSSLAIEKKNCGKLEYFTLQVWHSNHLIFNCLKYCVKKMRGWEEMYREKKKCEKVPVHIGYFFLKVAKCGMTLSYLVVKAAEWGRGKETLWKVRIMLNITFIWKQL